MYCNDNYLNLNVGKTKEVVFDFRIKKNVNPYDNPVCINGDNVDIVLSYKYLGTTVDSQLSWGDHVKCLVKKGNQRLYFLRKLRSFHVDRTIMNLFYVTVIESILTFDCVVWYNSAKQRDILKLKRVTKHAGRIIEKMIDLDRICEEKVEKKAISLINDENHPMNRYYEKLQSGRRWRSEGARTNRYSNSFIPYSIRTLNT